MKMQYGMAVTVAAVACAMGLSLAAQARPAPDFSLLDIQGKTHTLSEYRDKYIVLEWTNPDCPFVKKHYGSGNMPNLQKKYTAKGVIWLSVNSSAPGNQGNYSPEEWVKIAAKEGAAPTAILLDGDGKVGHAYGAKSTPHMFVINPAGEIIYEGAIDDKPTTDLKDIEGATNFVAAALDSAMAGQPVETPTHPQYGCGVKY